MTDYANTRAATTRQLKVIAKHGVRANVSYRLTNDLRGQVEPGGIHLLQRVGEYAHSMDPGKLRWHGRGIGVSSVHRVVALLKVQGHDTSNRVMLDVLDDDWQHLVPVDALVDHLTELGAEVLPTVIEEEQESRNQ